MKRLLLLLVSASLLLGLGRPVHAQPATVMADPTTGALSRPTVGNFTVGNGLPTLTGNNTFSGNTTFSGALNGTPTGGTLNLGNATVTLANTTTWAQFGSDFIGAWDTFQRADGLLSTSGDGQTYLQAGTDGTTTFRIVSHKAAQINPGIGYMSLDAGGQIEEIGAEWTLATGTAGNSVLAVVITNDSTLALANLLHWISTDVDWTLQLRIGSNLNPLVNIASGTYVTPLVADDTKKYRFTMFANKEANTAFLLLPDGTAYALPPKVDVGGVTGADVGAAIGSRGYWQVSRNAGTIQPKITSIYLKRRNANAPFLGNTAQLIAAATNNVSQNPLFGNITLGGGTLTGGTAAGTAGNVTLTLAPTGTGYVADKLVYGSKRLIYTTTSGNGTLDLDFTNGNLGTSLATARIRADTTNSGADTVLRLSAMTSGSLVNSVSIASTGLIAGNVTGPATTNLVLQGGSSGAMLTLGNATSGNATVTLPAAGKLTLYTATSGNTSLDLNYSNATIGATGAAASIRFLSTASGADTGIAFRTMSSGSGGEGMRLTSGGGGATGVLLVGTTDTTGFTGSGGIKAGSATEATTGGAGSLITLGGLYATKKIISGSSISPSGLAAQWTSGTGSPEGVVTAPIGSMYTRTDGGAATSFYVKESGAGNTGWVAK